MALKRQLADLPNELLIHIVGYLDCARDISSISRLNHRFHWLLSDYLIDFCVTDWSFLLRLFFHAVKHDSANIIQRLTFYTGRLDLKGYEICNSFVLIGELLTSSFALLRFIPMRSFPGITFLHFALVADAPRVAAHLMKHGADISQEVGDYPDLTPLFLTLALRQTSKQKELDSALRIACSYALPRTTRSLLMRGADANTMSSYGVAAIHVAVTRRARWRNFDRFFFFPSSHLGNYGGSDRRWHLMIRQTVSALLDFGANVHLQTATSRIHRCDYDCWRSINCDHRGQTALHLVSASGIVDVVSLLLENGAEPTLPNEDGYTPLYTALVQGHEEIACRLLLHSPNTINPIVYIPHETSALHVACRFAFSQMVYKILENGADASVIDSHGRTPLHEALEQTRLDRKEVLLTLQYLAQFGADTDVTTANTQSPRQIAERHAFTWVKETFGSTKQRVGFLGTSHDRPSHDPEEPEWGLGAVDSVSRVRGLLGLVKYAPNWQSD